MAKPLIVVHSKIPLSPPQRERLGMYLKEFADREGYVSIVTDGDLTATADHAPLLEAMLAEQRTTNHLLATLIEALAEDGEADEESPPTHYMDGSPIG